MSKSIGRPVPKMQIRFLRGWVGSLNPVMMVKVGVRSEESALDTNFEIEF